MDMKETHACKGLQRIPELLDFEVLISRPGVGEPDSGFIWASNFMAPESLVFLDGQMFLNLFLPEGSENEPEKKVFLNRVGAKLQDGLWQVRRRMDQLKGKYGAPVQFSLSTFKTLILDQAYIKNGRNFAHTLMNHSDVEYYSRLLLRAQKESPDIRVEYFRKFERKGKAYLIPGKEEELSFITMEFAHVNGPDRNGKSDGQMFFTLANFVEGGVKAIAMSGNGKVPEILMPEDIHSPEDGIFTFRSNNKFILSLVRALAKQYVVIFGFYGTVNSDKITLTVAMPSEQVQVFMRTLTGVEEEVEGCSPIITEVLSLQDFME